MKLLLENWREYLTEDYQDTGYQDPKSFKHYGSKGRTPEELTSDRDFKRQWNAKADHNFFNNEVIKIHWIGGFGGVNLRGCRQDPEPCLLDVLQSWLGSQNPKNELSVVGYYNMKPKEGGDLSVIGIVVEGYVSFASSKDAATEWSSYADEEAREKHGGSGLPKRAMVKSPMFGKEDFVNPTSGHNELIIDNWKPVGIVLDTDFSRFSGYWNILSRNPRRETGRNSKLVKKQKEQEFKDILRLTKDSGLKAYDMDLKELNIT